MMTYAEDQARQHLELVERARRQAQAEIAGVEYQLEVLRQKRKIYLEQMDADPDSERNILRRLFGK